MIIAVDFDGTLHTGEFPSIGEISPDAKEYMQRLKADGHYLIIWTCREGVLLTEAINWLLSNDIPFHRVNDHEPTNKAKYGGTTRKVYAHLYVDDKQVGGLPSWEGIYEYARMLEATYMRKIVAQDESKSATDAEGYMIPYPSTVEYKRPPNVHNT